MTIGKQGRSGSLCLAWLALAIVVASSGCTGCDSSPVDHRPDHSQAEQPTNSTNPEGGVSSDRKRALQRGVEYLLAAQRADGAWHSDTYGQLRGGAATTALVLYALAQLDPKERAAYRRAAGLGFWFLSAGSQTKDFIQNRDGSADYPTYATAMALVAANRFDISLCDEQQRPLIQYLIQSQLSEAQGWKPDDPDYGGWDFVGYLPNSQRTTTGTSLSVTCCVLEALSRAHPDIDVNPAVIERAKNWVARCQNADGGFAFSPRVDDPANKAEWSDDARTIARSYGSMTCDGIRSLTFCGVDRDSSRLASGIAWIAEHHNLDVVPGFEQLLADAGWQTGLRYYYYASLAAALDQLDPAVANKLAADLSVKLISLQAADGSWQNESSRMREDDPLIATAFAVIALARLRDAEQ